MTTDSDDARGVRARWGRFSQPDVAVPSCERRPHGEGKPRPLRWAALPLRLGAALGGVVPESAGLWDHPVARDDDDRRVPRAGGSDRPARSRSTEATCDLTIRDRFARGDGPQEVEDLPFERRDLEVDGKVTQIPGPGVDMLEDPGQIGGVRSRGLSGNLPSQPHRRDAVPQ